MTTSHPGTLHLFCGKIAAGKSSLARTVATETGGVRLVEDDWTAALWPGELRALEDYRDRSRRLRAVLLPHVGALLRAGVTVVLDFAANTPGQRAPLRALVTETGASHVLHHLDVADAVCLARLGARNAAGEHAYAIDEATFARFARHFVAPVPGEGFTVRRRTA